jgi:DNA-binding CsgD family transcriptional regulator
VFFTARDKIPAWTSFIDTAQIEISAADSHFEENAAANDRFDSSEPFAHAEWRLKPVDSPENEIKPDYISRRNILDSAEWLITLTCEFESAGAAIPDGAAHWLDRLIPHLSRAARLQGKRFPALAERCATVQFIDEWRQPAMLVAIDGSILCANRAARRLVRHTTLVQIHEHRLTLADDLHLRVLDDCLGSTPHEIRPHSSQHRMLRMSASAGDDVLYVFYHLVASNRSRAALLTFYHPDSPPVVDPALLATAFDLTPAECRVAHSISEGRTPKEIAARLGVQHDTVRKQLQAIYQKTATNRQADLIRLLLHLPAHRAPDAPAPD